MGKLKAVSPRLAGLRPRLARLDDPASERERVRAQRPWRKWYGTARWKALRWQVLSRDMFTCQRPECGRLEPDTSKLVADHRQPHRGDEALFWSERNLWTLCASCHSGAKQREERRGDD